MIGWDPKAALSKDTWESLTKWIDLCAGQSNTERGVYRGKSFDGVRETSAKAKKVMKRMIIKGIYGTNDIGNKTTVAMGENGWLVKFVDRDFQIRGEDALAKETDEANFGN